MTENEAIVAAVGQVSHALLDHLNPIMVAHEKMIMNKMKSMYRAGDIEHLKLVACVAELCALEDMQTTLKSRVARAGKVMNERESK